MQEGIQILDVLASTKGLRARALRRALCAAEDGELQSNPSTVVLVVRCLQSEWNPSTEAHEVDRYFCLIQYMVRQLEGPEETDHVIQQVGTALVIIALMTDSQSPWMIRWLCQQKPNLRTMESEGVLMTFLHRLIQTPREFASARICCCLRILSSWTFVPVNKRFILAKIPNFVQYVASLAQPRKSKSKSRNVAVATILKNMASGAESVPIVMRVPSISNSLLRLLSCSHTPTVEAAVWCVASLAADEQVRAQLWMFQKGQFVRVLFLLSKLGKAQLEAPIATAMSRLLTPKHTALLLRQTCIQRFHRSSTKLSGIFAAQTLNRIASSISPTHQTYPDIVDKLCTLSASTSQYVRRAAVDGVFRLTENDAGCFFMARSHQVVSALLRRAKLEKCRRTQEMAVKTIAILASNPANARGISRRKEVIDALVKSCQANLNEVVVQALAQLAAHTKDRSKVAKSCGLMECLAQFGVSTSTNQCLKRVCLARVVSLVVFI